MSWGNKFLSYWYQLYQNQTDPEVSFEKELAKLGIPYRAQHPFIKLHMIADFALPTLKLVIEVDGDSHNRAPQKEKDLLHEQALQKLGWTVVRISNEMALRCPGAAVGTALTERLRLLEEPRDCQAALDRLRRDYPSLLVAAAKKATNRSQLALRAARKRSKRPTLVRGKSSRLPEATKVPAY